MSKPQIKQFKTGANMIVYKLGPNLKIHTYVSGEDSFGDATHIIETENYLTIIDSQYLKKYAKEFRAYAERLGKPGSVIISHSHPDHYLGLQYFKDVDIYALEEVIEDIKTKGNAMLKESQKSLGKDALADEVIIPNKVLRTGEVIFDDVKYKYSSYKDAESDIQLVIELPEHKIIIVQDLVYNGYHSWIDNPKNINSWISIIEDLKKIPTSMVLVGHGQPTSKHSYDSMIRYLSYVSSIFDNYTDSKDIKRKIVEAYPEKKRKGGKIIDMYLSYLSQ